MLLASLFPGLFSLDPPVIRCRCLSTYSPHHDGISLVVRDGSYQMPTQSTDPKKYPYPQMLADAALKHL